MWLYVCVSACCVREWTNMLLYRKRCENATYYYRLILLEKCWHFRLHPKSKPIEKWTIWMHLIHMIQIIQMFGRIDVCVWLTFSCYQCSSLMVSTIPFFYSGQSLIVIHTKTIVLIPFGFSHSQIIIIIIVCMCIAQCYVQHEQMQIALI